MKDGNISRIALKTLKFYTLLTLMTNNIYPPDHLLRKWESLIIDEEQNVDVVLYEAFQAGADQELEACVEWMGDSPVIWRGDPEEHPGFYLREARRPKPLSLKEQVSGIVNCLVEGDCLNDDDAVTLRRALEFLPS